MLAVFRRYQKYIYLVVTAVIVISFSFFGTYGTLDRGQSVDKVAFTTISGREVKQSELDEFSRFLETDIEDKLLFGGAWGPNFLNDGVVKRDFFQTGVAAIVVESHLGDLRDDFVSRHRREKSFTPYVHPRANFISATNIWGAVAPDINDSLRRFQSISDVASPEAFSLRTKLYLSQAKFPAPLLRQLIMRQQSQYDWIPADPNLSRTNLSLFGYQTLDDWFGRRFMTLVSQFVINSSIVAEEQGYKVSKAEALADLYRNAEVSFRQVVQNTNPGVATVDQYIQEQFRRMGLDQNRAVEIWRQVLLFRRLMDDAGNTVLVDPFTVEKFQKYVKETVSGDLYQLPEEIRFNGLRDMLKFETYLDAVAIRSKVGPSVLQLPQKYKTATQVKVSSPELVQKRYTLTVAKADKRSLQTKVGVKETWEWEVQDKNWAKLKEKFPELGVKKGSTQDERFAALDQLDDKTRSRVDAFARVEIVNSHPEWIKQQLDEAEAVQKEVTLHLKGETPGLEGLGEPEKVMALLDEYPKTKEELSLLSQNGETYYRIEVIEKSPGLEVLTFADANVSGVLDKLLDQKLDTHYKKIRETDKKTYQNEDGTWKPLTQVQEKVALSLHKNLFDAIKKDFAKTTPNGEESKELLPDYAATLRMYAHSRGLRDQLVDNPSKRDTLVRQGLVDDSSSKMAPKADLSEQFKLIQSDVAFNRGASDLPIDRETLFSLKANDWSPVQPKANGDIAFMMVREKDGQMNPSHLALKVMNVRYLLASEAQRDMVRQLSQRFEEKKALTIAKPGSE